MVVSKRNPLLATDVYKMGHMEQYAPGTDYVYSNLTARYSKVFTHTVFSLLQYYLKEYLTIKLEPWMAEEFLEQRKAILGSNSVEVETKIRDLCKLGYFPIEIKAVPEGSVIPIKNVLMTIKNTIPGYGWVVGFIESLIIKVWYPITVGTTSYSYRKVVDKYFEETVDPDMYWLKDFTVHDFGYRGDSSEEGAAISGAAHLFSFLGSDTVPAYSFLQEHYNADGTPIMFSVPASEHSVMCSFGRDNEYDAFVNMLDLYPSGLVSIVSDTFDVWEVLTTFAGKLKERILARDGKVVFRPDSGNPPDIICGKMEKFGLGHSCEDKGAIELLWDMFGGTVNSKGYKVLNPKVGLIYGDGMYLERYIETLDRLKAKGFAASNLVIGVGGILRNHSRDTLGFAIKATYVERNGKGQEIEKDPITDHGKKSLKGLLSLGWDDEQKFVTHDQCDTLSEKKGLLKPVFRNGKILKEYTLQEVRDNVQIYSTENPFN